MSKHQRERPAKFDRNFITGTSLQYKKDNNSIRFACNIEETSITIAEYVVQF